MKEALRKKVNTFSVIKISDQLFTQYDVRTGQLRRQRDQMTIVTLVKDKGVQ